MEGVRIGLQLYGVREACARDLPGTLKRLAAAGYQGIEFHDLYGHDPAQVRSWLDQAGLVCCGFHLRPFEAFVASSLEGSLALMHTLGSPFLILPGPLPDQYVGHRSTLRQAVALLTQAADRALESGLRIGYHNEGREFLSVEGEVPWEVLVRELPEEVFFQLDTGNAAGAGADPLDCLRRATGRLTSVHLKAYSQTHPNALIGDDELPWEDILHFLGAHGGTEWLVLEYESDLYEPVTAMEKSLENLRALLKRARIS